jgi:hypothetical protein
MQLNIRDSQVPNSLARPSFAGSVAGLGGMQGLDSMPLHRAVLSYETRDSVRIMIDSFRDTLRMITGRPVLFIQAPLTGDSIVGTWWAGGHYSPVYRGRAVVRRTPDPERPVATRPLPPIQEISDLVATSELVFRSRLDVAVQSTGRVVLSDFSDRRVLMLDSALRLERTVFDRNTPPPLSYPGTVPRLHRGAADTTYVHDLPVGTMRVIAPDGKVVRRESYTYSERGSRSGLYSDVHIGDGVMFYAARVRQNPGQTSAEWRDSTYLVRVNFETAQRDTFGILRRQAGSQAVPANEAIPGEPRAIFTYFSPFDEGDAMALAANGELAVIRGNDFHVDWLRADGTWRRSAPTQWPWRRMSTSEKDAFARENNAFLTASNAAAIASRPAGPPRPTDYLRVSRIADYKPAFVPMSAMADHGGLIWVQLGARTGFLPNSTDPATYAGIDTSGQVVRIFRLPSGRTLVGFDRYGRIYATTTQAPTIRLEVYRP